MNAIQLANTPAAQDYKGCGKAWIALDSNGQPLAIRYMNAHGGDELVGRDVADRRFRDGVRRVYQPKYSHTERTAIFEAYREKCRQELAALGSVVAGIVSCWEFTK